MRPCVPGGRGPGSSPGVSGAGVWEAWRLVQGRVGTGLARLSVQGWVPLGH